MEKIKREAEERRPGAGLIYRSNGLYGTSVPLYVSWLQSGYPVICRSSTTSKGKGRSVAEWAALAATSQEQNLYTSGAGFRRPERWVKGNQHLQAVTEVRTRPCRAWEGTRSVGRKKGPGAWDGDMPGGEEQNGAAALPRRYRPFPRHRRHVSSVTADNAHTSAGKHKKQKGQKKRGEIEKKGRGCGCLGWCGDQRRKLKLPGEGSGEVAHVILGAQPAATGFRSQARVWYNE